MRTSSNTPWLSAMQRTNPRPIRPKPLIPMRTFAMPRTLDQRARERQRRASSGDVRLDVLAARDLVRHFGDQLGRERDDLLLIEPLRLEVAVDRLREDLYRTGFGFTIGHG